MKGFSGEMRAPERVLCSQEEIQVMFQLPGTRMAELIAGGKLRWIQLGKGRLFHPGDVLEDLRREFGVGYGESPGRRGA